MYWQEEVRPEDYRVSDDVADLIFSIDGREIPVDHAYALSQALLKVAPWIAETPGLAIHSVHVAGSQNGWERPEHGTDSRLILSKRSKLTIRVPKDAQERLVNDLKECTLDVLDCPLKLGKVKIKPLSKQTTLFARYLVSPMQEDENQFLQRMVAELSGMNIRVRKALCGKSQALSTPEGPLWTRSLMLAELGVDEAVRLQQKGLGTHQHLGCGIFIPHKGIDAVHNLNDDK